MRNKRGWLKIVEAFTAVLLIMAVLLIIINRVYIPREDLSERIYEVQIQILKEVINDHKSDIILWSSIIPVEVEDEIQARVPDYLNCELDLCYWDDEGCIENYLEYYEETYGGARKNLYSQSIIVFDDNIITSLNHKRLTIFCWLA